MSFTIASPERTGRPPSTGGSDRALVERIQHGSHPAFAELVARHDRRLRALAFRILRDPERVADALQETYLKAFRTIDRFRGDANVGTWLYRITYNTCLDEQRRRHPITSVDDAFDVPSREPGPADAVVAEMEATRLLQQLPDALRTTVVLVDGYGFDYREASRLLDVPVGTVASRMSRARRRLRHEGAQTAIRAAEDAA